jgi:hypothetical protein
VFENIKTLRPYFHSLREVQDNVSLDIRLPLTWNFENIIKPYSTIAFKVQDKNEKYNLISMISHATQNGYDVVFACANEIVRINKEEEEKQFLFQQKVKELEELFKKQSLENLKEINLLPINGQKDTTSIRLAEQGDGKRQVGSDEPQESVD